MWILFAFLTAFTESAKDVIGKKHAEVSNQYIKAFSLQLFSLVILIPLIFITGIPTLKSGYFLSIIGMVLIGPLWSILYMRALTLSPLSVSVPMLAFNPIFTAGLAFFVENKFPDVSGWIGIFLVGLGLYLSRFSLTSLRKGILYPILSIREEPGALAMLGVSLLWSIGAPVSKLAVISSSPVFAAVTSCSISALLLFFIAKNKVGINFKYFKKDFTHLFSLGILNGISELALNLALQTGYTGYVIPIKRTNIIWSSLLGVLLFKEKLFFLKLLGLGIVMLGVILIIAF